MVCFRPLNPEVLSRWQPTRRAPIAPCFLAQWGQPVFPRSRSPARGRHPAREGSWKRHRRSLVTKRGQSVFVSLVSVRKVKNAADPPGFLLFARVSCSSLATFWVQPEGLALRNLKSTMGPYESWLISLLSAAEPCCHPVNLLLVAKLVKQ